MWKFTMITLLCAHIVVDGFELSAIGSDVTRILREIDVMKDEGLAENEMKWRELKERLGSLGRSSVQELNKAKELSLKAYNTVKENLKRLIKGKLEDNRRKEEAELQALQHGWQMLWDGFRKTITHTIEIAKKATSATKHEVEILFEGMKEDIKQHVGKDRFEEIGDEMRHELQNVEDKFTQELKRLEFKYESLLKQIDKHIKHETAYHGHAIMKCKACGREYSFVEFLDIFDHDHNLAVPSEEHYNDGSIEEYYDGWAEWANHLLLRCPNCEASQWEDIVLYDKKKDEL